MLSKWQNRLKDQVGMSNIERQDIIDRGREKIRNDFILKQLKEKSKGGRKRNHPGRLQSHMSSMESIMSSND